MARSISQRFLECGGNTEECHAFVVAMSVCFECTRYSLAKPMRHSKTLVFEKFVVGGTLNRDTIKEILKARNGVLIFFLILAQWNIILD